MSYQAVPPGPGISALSLSRKESSTAFFSHWLTVQPPRALLGDPRLAVVEQPERRLDRVAHLAPGRGAEAVARLPGGVDDLLKLRRHATFSPSTSPSQPAMSPVR